MRNHKLCVFFPLIESNKKSFKNDLNLNKTVLLITVNSLLSPFISSLPTFLLSHNTPLPHSLSFPET